MQKVMLIMSYNPYELIVNYSEYPKGFKILMKQYADKVEYITNYPLKEIRPGEFAVEFPLV